MKKIFNRVLAAAIAVPLALTQSVMSISAEDTGAKALGMDSFTWIDPTAGDKAESDWNSKVLAMALNMEGTSKEIAAADVVNLIPKTNVYGVMLSEILADAPNAMMTVNNSVITVSGSADLTAYATEKIYDKVEEAAGTDLTLTAFDKTVDYSVTVDASVLSGGKTLDIDPVVSIDGTEINADNAADYFNGLADDLAAEVSAQVAVDADIEEAMTVEIIDKIEKAEEWYDRAIALKRTGSYATADEMMAAIAKFADSRVAVYSFPASVDEAVARHGNGFNAAVELLNSVAVTSGYYLDITAADVAELAKSGSNFEVNVAGGTYNVTFTIPDAEADEVAANTESYVDDEGNTWVYYYSNKTVEFEFAVDGNVYYNVTRNIVMEDTRFTTTTTTTTTTGTGTTTTTTDTNTTTTTTTTGTGTDDSTTTTTTTTVDPNFELEAIEVEAGKDYYFSHDENAFDLASLFESLTLVGNVNGEATTIPIADQDYATYLAPAYATPADFFNAAEGAAYVANTLEVTFVTPAEMLVAEGADLTVANLPTVYIGVKGDADLNGKVGLDDATAVLTYYAYVGASMTPSFNEDAELEVLAYFLADVDTESKAGANTDTERIDLDDSSYILTYYAWNGASLNPTWDAVLGR